MSATKTSRLNLRVAPADDALLRQAAELLGETMYVAATRARDELVVTWEGEGSEFLHSSLVHEMSLESELYFCNNNLGRLCAVASFTHDPWLAVAVRQA